MESERRPATSRGGVRRSAIVRASPTMHGWGENVKQSESGAGRDREKRKRCTSLNMHRRSSGMQERDRKRRKEERG
eukprot:1179966-Pleurochrysis_carterae.AAC.2